MVVTLCGIFFGIGHGKGPHDGAGVMLKRFFKKS